MFHFTIQMNEPKDDAVSFAEAAAELKVPPMSAAQVVASALEAAGNRILGTEAMQNTRGLYHRLQ